MYAMCKRHKKKGHLLSDIKINIIFNLFKIKYINKFGIFSVFDLFYEKMYVGDNSILFIFFEKDTQLLIDHRVLDTCLTKALD